MSSNCQTFCRKVFDDVVDRAFHVIKGWFYCYIKPFILSILFFSKHIEGHETMASMSPIKVRLPSQQTMLALPPSPSDTRSRSRSRSSSLGLSSNNTPNQEKQEWKLVDSSFKNKEQDNEWNEFSSLKVYPSSPLPQPMVPKQIPIEDPIAMLEQDPLLTLVLSPSNSENDSMMQCDAVEVVEAISTNNTVSPPPPATHRIGSGSRMQWEQQLDTDTLGKLVMPFGGLVGMGAREELDMALEKNADDAVSHIQSEATFVTGNVSRNNSLTSSKSIVSSGNPKWFESKAHPLKPLKSPKDIRGRRRTVTLQPAKRDETPEQPLGPRRLVMCGAVNMDNNELVQDVNTTVRQIITTVRKFGVEEKKAVRNFFSCRTKDDTVLGQNNSLDLEIDDSYDIMSLDRELSSSSCLEQTHEPSIVEPTVSNDSDMISEERSILTELASIHESEEVDEIEFKPKRRLV